MFGYSRNSLVRLLAAKIRRVDLSVGLRSDSKVNPFVYQDIFKSRNYDNRLFDEIREERRLKFGFKGTPQGIDSSKIALLSNDEFFTVLKETIFINSRATDPQTRALLKNECFTRQSHTFDNVDMFYCADIMKKGNFYFDEYMNAISRTLMFKWDNIIKDKDDLLLFANFLSNSKSVATITIMDKVEKYLRENISAFSTREVGLMCHLFFTTNSRLRDFNTLEVMKKYLLETMSTNSKVYISDINNIVKVLRHANYVNVPFFMELGDKLCHTLQGQTCSYVHLSNLAFTYSSLHIQHDKFLNEVTRLFCEKIKETEQSTLHRTFSNVYQFTARLKDLSRLIWSRTTFGLDVPDILQQNLLECIHSNPSQVYQYPEIFIEALVVSAINKTYDPMALKLAFSDKFLEFKERRLLEQKFQLLLLKEAMQIEGGEEVKSIQVSKKYFDSIRDEVRGNIEQDLMKRQGLKMVIKTLHKLLGDWSVFKVNFILGFSKITDIELWVDESGNPQVINDSQCNEELSQILKAQNDVKKSSIISEILRSSDLFVSNRYDPIHLEHERPFASRKISIKVLGCNQYAKNTSSLNGLHQLELRLLHKLGYDVFVIDPYAANKFETSSESQCCKMMEDVLFKCGVAIKNKTNL